MDMILQPYYGWLMAKNDYCAALAGKFNQYHRKNFLVMGNIFSFLFL